jgi:hypothetical protein
MPGSEQNGRSLLGIFLLLSVLVFSGSAGQELFAFLLCDGAILLGFLSLSLLLTFVPFDFDSSFTHVGAWVTWPIPSQLSRQIAGTPFARNVAQTAGWLLGKRQTRSCLASGPIHLRIMTKNGMHVVYSVC